MLNCLEDNNDGLSANFQSTVMLTRELESAYSNKSTPGRSAKSSSPSAPLSSTEAFINMIRRREDQLCKCQDMAAKFLEAADAYHRVAKKVIEKKMASDRLWGNQSANDPSAV